LGVIAYFIVVGPEHLNPTNINWIQGGDGAQHYLGWTFFRHDGWRFPIGLNPNYGANIGSSIVFADAIPLFAIPFKILSPWLATDFQYFGLWTLLCFILQAWFGWLLTGLFTRTLAVQIMGSGLFVFAIPMLFRINLHAALTAHFFILAALYLNLSRLQHHRLWYWALLLVGSLATHFYIFAIIAALWLASALDSYWPNKTLSLKKLLIEITSLVTFTGFMAWQLGYFASASNETVLNHYGGFSPEFFVFFNSNGWSYLLPSFYSTTEEGTNFLGLGIILLLFIAICAVIFKKIPIWQFTTRYPFLLLGLLFLALIALSNHVRIGPWAFDYPLPLSLQFALGNVRNSGRFLWPHMYLITFIVIYLITRAFAKRAVIILILGLLLQIGDSSIKWYSMRQFIRTTAHQPSAFAKATQGLKSPFWNIAAQKYQRIDMVPLKQMSMQYFTKGEDWDWARFASFAATHKLATNMVYLSRVDTKKIDAANAHYDRLFKEGKFDPNTIYILDQEKIVPALMHLNPEADLLANIDGMIVLAPGWKNCQICPVIPIDHEYRAAFVRPVLNQPVMFNKDGNGTWYLIGIGQFPRIGWGWSYPESWGVWAEGREAHLALPTPLAPFSSLIFDTNPLLSPSHQKQRVVVKINGDFHSLQILDDTHRQMRLSINSEKLGRPDYLAIEFIFIDQAKPQEIGLGVDARVLSIGLISAIFE